MKQIFSRYFTSGPDPREELRPLWHWIVEQSRSPEYYTDGNVCDTVEGRFDMITAVLALVLLRFEQGEALAERYSLLTELFVADMDAQIRELGVGDLVVGKHMGKLMASLGGRLGAYRDALAAHRDERDTNHSGAPDMMEAALNRNMHMNDGASAASLATKMFALADQLRRTDDAALLRAEITT